MSRTSDFTQVHGVAKITWQLETATPLCIKAGTTSSWKQSAEKKTRNLNARFDFFTKSDSEDASVADFYYLVRLNDKAPHLFYTVPPASMRGALRSHTIRKLAPQSQWGADLAVSAKKEEIPQQSMGAKDVEHQLFEALKTPGWHLVQNLFGLATDSGSHTLADQSVAGRLQITTEPMSPLDEKIFRDHLIDGQFSDFKAGALNGRMLITPRSPLCRITQAAKQGGLHSFMEMDRGNAFSVTLHITNPHPADLGMVAFWEQEIAEGFLRLGGLSSIGRGRLTVTSTRIELFQPTANEFPGNWEPQTSSDRLADILPTWRLMDWSAHKPDYIGRLEKLFNPQKPA